METQITLSRGEVVTLFFTLPPGGPDENVFTRVFTLSEATGELLVRLCASRCECLPKIVFHPILHVLNRDACQVFSNTRCRPFDGQCWKRRKQTGKPSLAMLTLQTFKLTVQGRER